MLIVLGGALIGVLIEAFVGKARRPIIQLGVAAAALILALTQVIRIRELKTVMGALISCSKADKLPEMSIELSLFRDKCGFLSSSASISLLMYSDSVGFSNFEFFTDLIAL
jgi:hypothetical protein